MLREVPGIDVSSTSHSATSVAIGFVYRCKRCIGEAVTRSGPAGHALGLAQRELQPAGAVESAAGLVASRACALNLHFHHVGPSAKSFDMHMGVGKALAAFREEAKKCVLVCANCHGEIEARFIESPPPGSVYREAA